MFHPATGPPEWTETIKKNAEIRKNDERNWLFFLQKTDEIIL